MTLKKLKMKIDKLANPELYIKMKEQASVQPKELTSLEIVEGFEKIKAELEEALEDHEPEFKLKTNQEIINMICEFGCGETEFHTGDIERLVKENNYLRQHSVLNYDFQKGKMSFDNQAFAKASTSEMLRQTIKEKRKIGLREFAEQAGVLSSEFSRISWGKTVDITTFIKICNWMGKSPFQFIVIQQKHKAHDYPQTVFLREKNI